MDLQRICDIQPRHDYRLRVTYSDGVHVDADIRPMIERGGVFAPLADPAEFAKVVIGAHGRSIEWPNGADLCADALRLQPTQEAQAGE
jgi:hypothetical protein